MKKFTLFIISIWVVLFLVQPVYAGFATQPKQASSQKFPQKIQTKVAKMLEKAEKTVQKLSEKQKNFGKILQKQGDIRNKWLVPMLVFLIAAIVLALIPVTGFAWISYISYVGFVIFFFLWLLSLLDVI